MPEKTFFVTAIKKALIVCAAFVAGLANGIFGGGAGMLIVPTLSSLCGLDQKRAHATAIAVVLPLSVLSSVLYTIGGTHDFMNAAYVGFGVAAGGAIGAILLNKTPKGALTVLFYGVMIYAGVRMIVR